MRATDLICVSLLGTTILTPFALAQGANSLFDRTVEPVSERTNPDYDPRPIPSGSVELLPVVDFSSGFGTNVRASDQDEADDVFYGINPSLSLQSVWTKHEIEGFIGIDHAQYSDLDDESRTNYEVKLRGRLDLGEKTQLVVKFIGEDDTEDRSEISNVAGSTEPNEYNHVGSGIGLNYEGRRLRLEAGASIDSFNYDDVEVGSGLFQDQDFRDRDEMRGRVRVDYALDRSLALFADVEHLIADYSDPNVFTIFDRDHNGTVALFGTNFQFGDALAGDIGLGYQYYTYDEVAFEDISDFAFAGHVNWRVAKSTTVEAEAARAVIDPGVVLANAAIETGGSVRLEQALSPRFYLNGEAGFRQYDFETIDRSDDRVDLKLGANWKVNQSMWLEAGYQLIDQTSDVQPFTDNRMLLKMRIFP